MKIAIAPNAVTKLMRQAHAYASQGRIEEAHAAGLRVLALAPDNIAALYLVGSIDLAQQRHADGARRLERLLALRPHHIDALNNYGMYLLEHRQDAPAALDCFTKILRQDPNNLNANFNLGCVHLTNHAFDEAATFFNKTLELNPSDTGALNNMGALHVRQGRRDLGLPYYRRALAVSPDDTDILANLMTSAMAVGDTPLALELFAKTCAMAEPGAALFPAFAFAKMTCFWDEVDTLLPQVVCRILDGRCTLSTFETVNLPLLASQLPKQTLFDIHKKSGAIIAALSTSSAEAPLQPGKPVGRLRIGYLSPDFRQHVVSAFVRGLINHHDRDRFEIYCYSNSPCEDDITRQYQASADGFRDVKGLSDAQLAARIRADGIHILVDLAGYTQNSRTTVLRLCAAPVQIMYLGYPYTSGLTQVDYFISDPWLDGPANAAYFTERQLQLPESFITFDALHEQCIDPLIPWEKNGFITFGSMNGPYKLTRNVVAGWARVLHAVPGSRMIINHPNTALEETQRRLRAEFAKHGIDPERIAIIWDKHPAGNHLRYYNDFDIMLDTFPQTGGTTTIDAVWMGVPVITLVGDIYPERLSYSILNNVGLPLDDLCAFTLDEYVEKAAALASTPPRLRELRRRMPEALHHSILCDPVRLTRHMEAAYIRAWNEKYPDARLPLTLDDEPATVVYLPAADATMVAASGETEDFVSYVLQEQQGWFDPEYRFVLDWLQPGMRALDIHAGHGIYTLPMAKKTAPGAVYATTENPREGWYLARGKEYGHLANLDIMIEGERRLRLDDEMQQREWNTDGKAFDFVRWNVPPHASAMLTDGAAFFAQHNPLVMFSIRRGRENLDTGTAATFRGWGYAIYRLIPGLGLLAGWSEQEELDAFALNLFAAKPARAAQLAAAKVLAIDAAPLASFPGVQECAWGEFLRHFPYAAPQLDAWAMYARQCPDWEAYWSALNLFAHAQRPDLDPAQRLASLNTCVGILVMLAQASPSVPRLLSLARALSDAGRRQQAAQVLQQLAGMLEHGGLETEPFLAACPALEAVDPGTRLGEWIDCCVLEQFERLRTLTSYFGGAETIALLENVVATGFASDAIVRRRDLVKARLAAQGQNL